jgi:hypothetical protein
MDFSFGIITNGENNSYIDEIENLERILSEITDSKIQQMQNYYLELRDKYFKLNGICNYIKEKIYGLLG